MKNPTVVSCYFYILKLSSVNVSVVCHNSLKACVMLNTFSKYFLYITQYKFYTKNFENFRIILSRYGTLCSKLCYFFCCCSIRFNLYINLHTLCIGILFRLILMANSRAPTIFILYSYNNLQRGSFVVHFS